jgi:four helix bundle protein
MAVRLAHELPRHSEGRHVAAQVVRSGTAGGAIYEEARAAESRADFIHKIRLAAKEVRETLYWLRLIERTGLVPGSMQEFTREANELTAILVASARTARRADSIHR